MNKSKVKSKKLKVIGGFTILESIVAIFILSLSISGAFSAVQQGLSQSIIAKDEVKAFYLAQEAMEIIRNKRDTNQLAGISGGTNTWLDGITSACPVGNTCTVDVTNFSIYNCGIGGWGSCSQNLKQETETDPKPYLYNYSIGNTTNFKREIQIEPVSYDTYGNPIEIAVTVRVSWTKGSLPEFVFKAKTLLFNWI